MSFPMFAGSTGMYVVTWPRPVWSPASTPLIKCTQASTHDGSPTISTGIIPLRSPPRRSFMWHLDTPLSWRMVSIVCPRKPSKCPLNRAGISTVRSSSGPPMSPAPVKAPAANPPPESTARAGACEENAGVRGGRAAVYCCCCCCRWPPPTALSKACATAPTPPAGRITAFGAWSGGSDAAGNDDGGSAGAACFSSAVSTRSNLLPGEAMKRSAKLSA
mmetsp:Transcript_22430/g.64419  ORF Transcript_22430/g.64419 Transcript_22430/m.64419 type:complete len:218 (-) Transcript_22430:884-1537(-)